MGRKYFDIRKATKRRKFILWFNVFIVILLNLAFIDLSYASNAQLITGRPPSFTEFDSSNIVVQEGGDIALKCPIVFDGFDIEWYKGGSGLQQSGSQLYLSGVSRSDSGEYQCYASNGIGGAYSPVVNVTVLYLDAFDEEDQSFYTETVSSTDYFTLEPPHLIASPQLKISWRWLFEGHEVFINDTHYISTNGDLVVLKASGYFGNYKLEADSEKGSTFSETYTVSEASGFAPPPEFMIVLRPKDVTVNAGNSPSATFECVPSLYGRYPAEIKWLLNGEALIIDGREVRTEHSNRRLVISNVMKLLDRGIHSAKVRCEAKTGDDQLMQYAEAHLEITEKPQINKEILPSEISHPIGASMRLECKTTKAWPRARFQWYFNKEKVQKGNSEVLKIDHLEANNFGVYQCKASNIAGTDIAQIWIKTDDGKVSDVNLRSEGNAKGQLVFIDRPEDTTVPAGKDVTFQCRTEDPHNTQLLWSLNGTEIPRTNPRYTTNSTTLIIHQAKNSDNGVYTCFANSNGLTSEASARLLVSGSTLLEYGPSNQSILIGSNVHIPCKLADEFAARSDYWTSWTRNGIEIPSTGDTMRRISLNGGNLMINQVGPDNIGLYKCTVRSQKGEEESASGWLKIIEKPSMPQNVHAELVNDTVPAKIRVSWRPGFDGNSPIIRHSIEMRTIGPTGLWSVWENVVENVPSELCCSALIDNIRPSSTAEFRVISYNRFGAGKASRPSEEITMPQQPPAAAPRNVAASARSSSSVMVQWQPPLSDQWSGEILGYHVRYRLSGYATADWNEKNVSNEHARNALIEPLITWREYEIQVAAYNDRGLGVYSKPIEVTTLEGVPMQAPQNVHVQVINSTNIKVFFDPPEQQMIPGVNLGYKIELWKGPAHVGLPYRTVKVLPELSRIDEEIGNLEKFGHYNLTTVCFTSPGDGPSSESIEVITNEDIPGGVASVDFDQVMSNSVVVLWEKPTEPNGILLKYIIRHWEEKKPEEKHTIEVSAEDTEVTVENLIPSTKYSIDVQAVTRIGPGPRVEAKFESGVPPELPGKPSSLAVSDINARSVVLQFVPGFDGHSFIRKWHVEACIGSSSIFTEIFNISAPKARSFVVEGLRPYTKYKLRLIAENVRGRGGPSDPTRVFQTRQTDPENAPERLFAEPISDNQISLVWTPLMSSHWNGDPSGYLIRYRAASGNKADNETSLEINDGVEWKEIRASNPKASELTLTGLRPYTSYQIKIYAENTFGKSQPSETVFATTYESVPSGAPSNVQAELDRAKRVVTVNWDEVEEKHRNGLIMGYTVRLVPDEKQLRDTYSVQKEVIGAEQHTVQFDDLRSFTEYRVFVVAFTIVGEGPQNSNPPMVLTAEDIPDEPTYFSFSQISSTEVRPKWLPPANPNGKILAYEMRQWKYGKEKEAAVIAIPYHHTSYSAIALTPNTTYFFGLKAETTVGWGPEEIAAVYTADGKGQPPVPNPPQKHPNKPPTTSDIWVHLDTKKYENRELLPDEAPVRWISLQYQKVNQDEWVNYPHAISPRKTEVQLPGLSPNTAYKVRIRYTGDFAESPWSSESDWIKTLEAAPAKPPSQLQASPYESSSIMLQFTVPDRSQWNSDRIGYRILYHVYPSNDTFKTEEIPASEEMPENGRVQHLVQKLASFHHYVVQVQSFNSYGNSVPSRPAFVYVGYSIPKQTIKNLIAEPLSSTSIKVRWDEWGASENDVISGYRVRYAPLLSSMSPEIENEANGGESTEEIVISERNEIILTDLRKYQEYQISVAGYNRAGEGQSTPIRIRTLEDLPGPVGTLDFHDILLDSVNVSWTPPQQPNGRIIEYLVKYRTYKLAAGYENSVNQKTTLNNYIATKLEENATYFFTVQAVNSAGKGAEVTDNVTIGFNVGAPDAPSKPTFASEPSSFVLYWKDSVPGTTPIVGHVIQAKRVGTAKPKNPSTITYEAESMRKRAKREDYIEYQPQHVIGEWITISNVIGTDTEYRISYRQLEPASIYVFRVFARNRLGIGLPSTVSDELIVPESIPDDPFYTKWWFVAVVGGFILFVVFIFIALLCLTNSNKRYKGDKRPSFDSLQLADGGIVSYELRQSKNKQVRRSNDLPPRPDTHTSWISNDQIRDPMSNGCYGSIASEVDGGGAAGSRANSVYRALATDNLPPQPSRHSNYVPYSSGVQKTGAGYASRTALNEPVQPKSPIYRLSDYNSAHLVNERNFPYTEDDYGFGRDKQDNDEDEGNTSTDNFARHYQVSNGNEDIYRATWRRTKEQAEQQQAQMRSPLPPPPTIPMTRPPKLSEMSVDTSVSDSSSQTNGLAPGISLRALFPHSTTITNHPVDRNSSGSHTPLGGASSVNGFSSFV